MYNRTLLAQNRQTPKNYINFMHEDVTVKYKKIEIFTQRNFKHSLENFG